MNRVLSSACLVLLGVSAWLAGSGSAWAEVKRPIAILGLEVYDNGSGIDPETTKAAKELTAALRDRAKAGTGPYAPVPGGEKELIDEKLLNNCDSEAPVCMAAIGSELSAEVLMYGKIEKSTQGGQPVYKVSLKVLNVPRKQLASSTVETLPLSEATGSKLAGHARIWYAKLASVTSGGTVTVKANVDRGTVLIDDDVKGSLASGSLTIPGVPEGRRKLTIEAKDYERYETAITVRTGETLSHTATLAEMSSRAPGTISREGTVDQGTKKSNVWKPVFYVATVLEAGAIGFTLYEWRKGVSEGAFPTAPGDEFGKKDCDGTRRPADPGFRARFERACDHYKLQLYGWGGIGVFGAAMVGSFVMAYMRDNDPDTTAAAGQRKARKRRELAITPVLAPNGGGATLRFDW